MQSRLNAYLNPMGLYRLGAALRHRGLRIPASMVQGCIFLIFKAVIPVEASIGPDTFLAHGGVGVVIHPHAVIGSNVMINTGVVIGGRRKLGAPTIGDNVYLGTGCKVLGNVTVGSGSIIGANAVVTRDVPPRAIAAGVPARVLRSDVDVEDFEELPVPIGESRAHAPRHSV